MEQKEDNTTKSESGTVVEENTSGDSGILEYQSSMFQGPLPHPEVLAGYEKTLKGAADRILTMAEEQSRHRRDLESKVVISNIQNEKTGMTLAFTITVLFIILSGILIYFDKTIAGYLTLGTVVIGHAYNYLMQKKKEQELAEPDKHQDIKDK